MATMFNKNYKSVKKDKITNTVTEQVFDIYSYGDYRMGLTNKEIKDYLVIRHNDLKKIKIKKCSIALFKKFCKIAGVNTCALGPNGEILMYRHDVQRFADVLFLNKPTYFD